MQDETYVSGRYSPEVVGYNTAAFVRYRAVLGADVSTHIDLYPASQWEAYGDVNGMLEHSNIITSKG